ncbi:MAG: VCBS repeat-containing protein, partial [Aureliella sp.]
MNSILEIVGGGVSCFDFDGDGNCDLFFGCGGQIDPIQQTVVGSGDRLMKGDGQWGFRDCTNQAHLDTSRLYSHGTSWADWNQDGFNDLLVYGYQGARLWYNLGDGTFAELSPELFDYKVWTTAAAWVDLNGDQTLDCYLGSYVDWNFGTHRVCENKQGIPDVCSPNAFGGMRHAVFLNQGDGSFLHAPELLVAPEPTKTLSALTAEFSPGQGVGVYVANDLIANSLFLRRDGHFVEQGLLGGVAGDDKGVV